MNDLEIENYSLDDLLKLFEMSEDFNEYELKNAKKIVLRIHPDKSGLPSEYFLFYSKAYKMLYSIWEFKNKSILKNESGLWKKDDELDMLLDDNNDKKKQFVDSKTKNVKDVREFNKWFNDEFEKSVLINDKKDGYDEWFRTVDSEENGKNMSHVTDIEVHKKKARDLIVYDGVMELPVSSSGYYHLNDENKNKQDGYSSDLFSPLPYQDLYVAHNIPVIPVSEKDYSESDHIKNVDEYKKNSDALVKDAFDNHYDFKYLEEKTRISNDEGSQIAYRLAKETEESVKRNNIFWSKFNLLHG